MNPAVCVVAIGIIIAPMTGDPRVEDESPLRAEAAFRRLQEGHARFLADMPAPKVLGMKERVKLAMAQRPFAIVLACADSRVAPELIFDQGLGDLFVLRVAGNVAEPGTIGSMEYAVEHLHCPLIVVLGHENCGAVKAAMHLDDLHGNLAALVSQVRLGKALPTDPTAAWNAAVRANALHHAGELTYRSTMLRDYVAKGRVQIIAGAYSLKSGDVEWLLPKNALSPE